ncbi:hypothetical protein [Mucilaginibacter dorajii]|uniref:Uncharacterized protein n=1 Tax=Mucilaginibacter dorajii TaxID=692994 RepID=A0ABP7NZZ9_9SPHI|nr:hypothetical protein [Mucilaginibacter dorajii]MCS3735634.1 hypothetical protein [Mucilaginibacter dorajii]
MQQHPNLFAARYKTLSDAKLLAILNSPHNYQPLAIEAANAELESRQLSTELIDQLNAEAEITDRQKALKQQKVEAVEQSILSVIKPQSAVTGNIYITIVATIILYVVAVSYSGRFVLANLFNPGFYSVTFFHAVIPYLLFPVGIVLFTLKKKAGWVIITAVNIYKALFQLLILQGDISVKMDHLFSSTISYRYLFTSAGVILFSILASVFICRADIRVEYKVSDRLKVFSLSAGVVWLMYDVFKQYF